VNLPKVAFSAAGYNVPEHAGTATITVTLSATSTETVTVDYRTEQLGNATACTGPGDCDYTPTQGQLIFDPGDTVATFGVDIVDDDLFENYIEGLQLTLENADNAIGTPTSADLDIEDNDDPPIVAFSAGTYTAGEDAGTASITVTLQGQTTVTATVVISTTGGTATPGADYTAMHRTLVFTPGVTSQVVPVALTDDVEIEGGETVLLALGEPQEATVGTPAGATLEITDDDDLPVVAFSAGTYTAGEDAGTIPITVTLDDAVPVTATVVISTTGGTATPGTDYVSVHRTLVFTPGVTSHVFTVSIVDDAIGEGDETVALTLGEPSDATIGTPAEATLEITDDDPLPVVAFSAGGYTVREDIGTAAITVTLQSTAPVTATVVVSTTGGTATPGEDYAAIHRTLVFTPGVTSQVFTVSIVDDAIGEDDETVVLTLGEATNATIGTNNPALLTIIGGYEVYLPLVVR
jgi:hypothetical protein